MERGQKPGCGSTAHISHLIHSLKGINRINFDERRNTGVQALRYFFVRQNLCESEVCSHWSFPEIWGMIISSERNKERNITSTVERALQECSTCVSRLFPIFTATLPRSRRFCRTWDNSRRWISLSWQGICVSMGQLRERRSSGCKRWAVRSFRATLTWRL